MTSGQVAAQIIAYAITGGISAALQGGKFGHGFFAAGVTKGAGTPLLDNVTPENVVGGPIISAAIAGTASKISGGKFANGAMTATFQAILNHYGSVARNNDRATLDKLEKRSHNKFLDDSANKTFKYGTMIVLPGAEFIVIMRGSLVVVGKPGAAGYGAGLVEVGLKIDDGSMASFDFAKLGHDSMFQFYVGPKLVDVLPTPYRLPASVIVNSYSNTVNFVTSYVETGYVGDEKQCQVNI
ncbi:hypothetical protein [Thalassomonas actiniarum]|uniref:DUF637 domain-containing protein n=1 Tax=Thalassomonas actiniarum TaxID=485447 RepID=A0AAE9YQY6_9GAMM|nr:hypothetical protein [Thalassomonas actiniarum]WDD99450.1 hypothetical protein SG35_001840 [Thalassomonas actiniarum]